MTLLHREDPDPEQAATATRQALTVLGDTPTRSTIQRAGEVWRDMNGRWHELPAVRDLGEMIAQQRRALPAATA